MRFARVAVLSLLLAACGGTDPSEDQDTADLEYGTSVHKLPFNDQGAPAAARGPHLSHFGGKVISKAKVVQVLYGTGTFQSFVSGNTAPNLASFYGGVTNSAYFDWLTEYNTPSRTIGRGSFSKKVSITPAAMRNHATITDANIQAEISSQIGKGVLPAPDANTIYMVDFPKGKTVSQGGTRSCVAGGFCAYHGTFKRNSVEIYYGVLPDMSAGSGCDRGCGNGTAFGNQTSVASHELIETVTDAEVGLATVLGPPLAWYDPNNGEIGDICNGQQGSIAGGDGRA